MYENDHKTNIEYIGYNYYSVIKYYINSLGIASSQLLYM